METLEKWTNVKVKQHYLTREIASAFKYRKHSALIIPTDRVELQGTYWDEGSKSSYAKFQFSVNPHVLGMSYPCSPPQFGGGPVPTVEISNDFAVIELGISRGKPALMKIFATPRRAWELINSEYFEHIAE